MLQRTAPPSTTRRPVHARIAQPPAGQRHSPPKPVRPVSHRRPVTVTLTYLPGGSPWVRVETDSGVFIRPGTMPLWQLVLYLNGWR